MKKLATVIATVAMAFTGLAVSPAQANTRPANDNMSSPQILALNGQCSVPSVHCRRADANGSNVNATKEANERNHAGNSGGASVWYQVKIPATGHLQVIVSSPGAGSRQFDNLLAAYRVLSDGSLTSWNASAQSTLGPNGTPAINHVNFPVREDQTFKIAVDGKWGAQGTFSIVAILDSSPPTVSLDTTTVRALEGNRGEANPLWFKIKLSKVWMDEVTYTVQTRDWGSAIAGVDFYERTATFRFPPGRTEGGFKVLTRGDDVREADETMYVELTSVSPNAIRATGSSGGYTMGVIVNDDR